MKLLTKEILEDFKKTGSQENVKDPRIIVKFFNPTGAGYWYATEYDPEEKIFFGYAFITDGEFGSFSLEELESFKGRFGLGIERDLHFGNQTRVSEIIKRHNQ